MRRWSNCPSASHGEPGDPYGCYEEMHYVERLEERMYDAGRVSVIRELRTWADQPGRRGLIDDLLVALEASCPTTR